MPLVAVAGLIIGLVIARFLFQKNIKRQKEESGKKAEMILQEAKIKAESLKKEKILQAKEQYLKAEGRI